jgi:hypothetical protein
VGARPGSQRLLFLRLVQRNGRRVRPDRSVGKRLVIARELAPTGVAFDTKRDRALVTTFGDGPALRAYSPATGRFSLLSTLDSPVPYSITYSAADDALYG